MNEGKPKETNLHSQLHVLHCMYVTCPIANCTSSHFMHHLRNRPTSGVFSMTNPPHVISWMKMIAMSQPVPAPPHSLW